MALRIPTLLNAILEATALEAAAKARITALRKVLDEEARRRYAEDGAAPTWKARDAGVVRFDAPGEWAATIADEAAFGSYLAERHPEEVLGVIYVNATDLADTLQALGFIGVTPLETRTEVRQPFAGKYLEGLVVDVEEDQHDDGTVDRTVTVVDPDTGQLVDGVTATRANAAGRLVVTLDRAAKARALEAAAADAAHVLAEATGGEALRTEVAQVPAVEGRVVSLEEAVAAGVVRPASELPATVTPEEAARRAAGHHRIPYVGDGADGARRSAQIDREEADGLDLEDPRHTERLESAHRWDLQAEELEALALLPSNAGPHGNASTVSLGEALALQDNPSDGALAALEAAANREELRRLARAKGVNPGGTKRDVVERLYAAGVRAEDLRP